MTPYPFGCLLHRLSKPAAWICLLVLAALSLVPGPFRPQTGFGGHAEHFLAYFLTAIPTWIACTRLTTRVLSTVALSCLAASFEILQVWVPGRSAQVSDWQVSSAGAVTAATAIFTIAWALDKNRAL